MQHAEGLSRRRRSRRDEIARLNPAVRLDGVVGGAFCPSDGFIRPLADSRGLSRGRRAGSASREWGVEVTGLRRDAGRPHRRGRDRRAGASRSIAVVNAAGPWAAPVAAWPASTLPVTPLRRQIATTTPCDLLPADMPMTIWAGDGFHLRVRDGRVLLLRPTPGVPGRPFDATVDPRGSTRSPPWPTPGCRCSVGDDRPGGCWAGLYEMSPDKHAILGAATGCPNLFCINGSSGHGVMHAPALGQLLAEIICDGGRDHAGRAAAWTRGRFERRRAHSRGSELL